VTKRKRDAMQLKARDCLAASQCRRCKLPSKIVCWDTWWELWAVSTTKTSRNERALENMASGRAETEKKNIISIQLKLKLHDCNQASRRKKQPSDREQHIFFLLSNGLRNYAKY